LERRPGGNRFGGYVIQAQAISVESDQLADAFSQEILVKTPLIAASEGEIKLSAQREGAEFSKIILSSSTSSARRAPLLSDGQVRRLAMDVRAKVLTHASAIDATARKVAVTIYPRRTTFDIDVTITYR